MASERQIAANRRNAKKSTGPRSRKGKQRTRLNAIRHGLRSRTVSQAADEVEHLARKIAGRDASNQIALEYARAAAEAELERRQAKDTQLALIERASALGALEAPRHFKTPLQGIRWFLALERWIIIDRGKRPEEPQLQNPLKGMPAVEPERSSEAISRIRVQLMKIAQYESRAARRRDKAIRELCARLSTVSDRKAAQQREISR
jgi:hypothetical protein